MSKIAMSSTAHSEGDSHVKTALNEWFQEYGIPQQIWSDNGGPFITQGSNIKLLFFLLKKRF